MKGPYERFKAEELILRDELAIERTLLANERTLLAYLRSGVALLLAGITFIHFAQHPWFRIVGLACVPLGVAVIGFGFYRFRVVTAKLRACRDRLSLSQDIHSASASPDKRPNPASP